jgi:hypothetical protein
MCLALGRIKRLPGAACLCQQTAHTAGLSHHNGMHIRFDKLHGVVDGHACCDHTTWAVDVQANIFVRIVCFQKQQLRHNQTGCVFTNFIVQHDHTVFQQATVDIVTAFALGGLF